MNRNLIILLFIFWIFPVRSSTPAELDKAGLGNQYHQLMAHLQEITSIEAARKPIEELLNKTTPAFNENWLIPAILQSLSQRFKTGPVNIIAQLDSQLLNSWLLEKLRKKEKNEDLVTETISLLQKIITGSICNPTKSHCAGFKQPLNKWSIQPITVTPAYQSFMKMVLSTKSISPDDLGSQFGGGGNSTALTFALSAKDLTELLLKAGANPNKQANSGVFPLAEAVRRRDTDLVKLLIKYKADPNLPTLKSFGHSIPLHFWALIQETSFTQYGDVIKFPIEILEVLLKGGADVEGKYVIEPELFTTETQAMTVLDYARRLYRDWPQHREDLKKKILLIYKYLPWDQKIKYYLLIKVLGNYADDYS